MGCGAWVGERVDWRLKGVLVLGENCKIYNHAVIGGTGRIEIGDRTGIKENTMIVSNGGTIEIGPDCQIAHMISLKTSTHHIRPGNDCIAGETEFHDIRIGRGCWIRAGVIILPGVAIGSKNICAAGAVVMPNMNGVNGCLLAGVPASVKKVY